jgi:hypothetical protein
MVTRKWPVDIGSGPVPALSPTPPPPIKRDFVKVSVVYNNFKQPIQIKGEFKKPHHRTHQGFFIHTISGRI